MKHKKILIIIFLMMALFLSFNRVDAKDVIYVDDITCSQKTVNQYINKALSVKVNYEFFNEENAGRFFRIKISNFQKDIVISFQGQLYTYEQYKDSFYLNAQIPYEGGTYVVKFYGDEGTPCVEEYLTKKTLKIPTYNVYSELDDCIEYEEFPMCAKYYGKKIENIGEFYTKLAEWKANNLEPDIEDVKIGFFQRIKEFIEDNQLLVAVIGIILGLIIIALIIRSIYRRIKRQKIKF